MEALARNKNKALASLALCLLMVHGFSFVYGVFPSAFFWSWFIVLGFTLVSYVLAVLCLIIGVLALIKKQAILRYSAVWIVLSVVVFWIPAYYSEFAGALSSFQLAGPQQEFSEARSLINECRQSQQNCGPISSIPPAIQRVHPLVVDVQDDFVVIGKLGIFHPDGFVIFSMGSVPPAGMRVKAIGDELYWTYGN